MCLHELTPKAPLLTERGFGGLLYFVWVMMRWVQGRIAMRPYSFRDYNFAMMASVICFVVAAPWAKTSGPPASFIMS